MKKYKLLMIFLVMSYSIFSQGLKPIVQRIGNDTVYSFSTHQAKAMAKLITNGVYSDSVARRLENENALLYKVIGKSDSIIVAVNLRLKVTDSLNHSQGQFIEYQGNELKASGEKLKRLKRHRTVLGSILAVGLILILI